jgi:lipid-binding SYLF domain-containing protein
VIPGFKGNGQGAHEDPSAQIIVYGHTKGAFAGFGLDGATLKRDQSGDKALYGKDLKNSDIVDGTRDLAPGGVGFWNRIY